MSDPRTASPGGSPHAASPVSGPLSVTPLYAAGDQIVSWDGAEWNELPVGGAAGPIDVTGDVSGTGTGTVPTTVLGLQRRPVSNADPLDGQVLGWSAGQWRPVPAATVTGGGGPPGGATGTVQINAGGGNFGGITIGGDATLNYSTGALSLAPMPGLAAGPYQGITFDAKGRASAAVNMNYAPLASPAFTGVPTAPTAPAGTNSIQLATTAYVDSLYSPGAYIDTNGVSVTLSDGASVNLCSVSLAAGDWIIDGSAYFSTGTALVYNFMLGASTTSATLPGIPYYTQISPAGATSGGTWTLNIPERKFSLVVPTTVYLVVRAGFGSGSTVTAQGHIAAQQLQKLIAGVGGGGPLVLSGDVSTAGTVATVTGLQGRPVANTLPTDTQVLAWSGGAWRPTPAGTGGSGTPGPSPGYVQYNAAGSFGGSSGATFSATQLTSLAVGIGAGSDALGDIYFRNVSGNLARLAAGGPGYVLQMQGGVPTWQSIALGGGTVNPGTVGQIAQYTGSIIVGGVTMSGDATIAAGGVVTLAPKGTAGSYNNVTTDPQGRVIAGSSLAYLTANQTITMIGDNTGSGTMTIPTVTVGLQNRPVASTLPTNGQVLTWNTAGGGQWQPATPAGIASITFASPLTGGTISTSGQTVGLGQVPVTLLGGGTGATSSTYLRGDMTWQPIAAGGNVTATTLAANALTVGTTATAIVSLAAGTAGQVLHSNGPGLPNWGLVDLTSQVTNSLPVANLAGGAGANINTFWRGDGSWQTPPAGSGGVISSPQFQIPYYPTATPTASVQGHPAITTTTGGSLTINRNAVAPPAAPTGANILAFNFADADTAPNAVFDAYGANGLTMVFRQARGGDGTQTASQTGDPLGVLAFRGYYVTGGPAYTPAAVARISANPIENFASTTLGTELQFWATPQLSATVRKAAAIGPGLTVGDTITAQASPAVGDVNALRYFINGQPFSAADTTTGSITASTTLTQTGATVLTTQLNIVTTATTTTGPPYAGVALPAATVGGHCLVRNSAANPISVYPANLGGAQINILGATTPITVLPNSTAYFEAASTTQWFTVP